MKQNTSKHATALTINNESITTASLVHHCMQIISVIHFTTSRIGNIRQRAQCNFRKKTLKSEHKKNLPREN